MTTEHKSTRLPFQEALFDDGRKTSASALVAVTSSERPLSAAQRIFNRLAERIRRGRENLAAWEAFIPRFQNRVVTELQPVESEVRDAQRRLALRLQAMLAGTKGERLGRKQRAKVRALLLDIVDDLLRDGPDPDLETLHDRYSDISHAERRRQDMERAESMLGGILGTETVHGHEARDVGELLRHASEKIAEAAARGRESAGRARRRGTDGAAERKAQAVREASSSVRDIYRKLASALHPDRETDAAERERKTDLMQRANQAYERNDLLELLALQIETEQIDVGALASVPEARLRQYNEVLRDQTRVLEAQVEEQVAIFRIEFDLTARDLTTQLVDQALGARIARNRAALAEIERDLKRLDDSRQWRSVIDELLEPEPHLPDLEELAVLAAAFDETFQSARPVASRRKRRRRG